MEYSLTLLRSIRSSMKKIMLLLVFQFTALMAITYNVTNDGQMLLITEDKSPSTSSNTLSYEYITF